MEFVGRSLLVIGCYSLLHQPCLPCVPGTPQYALERCTYHSKSPTLQQAGTSFENAGTFTNGPRSRVDALKAGRKATSATSATSCSADEVEIREDPFLQEGSYE